MEENGHTEESGLSTTNTKLAAVLLLFGARLRREVPLDFSYVHDSPKNFIQNLKNSKSAQPKKRVTFNFENGRVPARAIAEAFEKDYEFLNDALEIALAAINPIQARVIRDAMSKVMTRACREVLEKREFLVNLINNMPEGAKWDEVHAGNGATTPVVKIGKNSSPELRARMLSKL